MDVVVNDYDTCKDIDGGSLGKMQEIISTDLEIDYEATKSINEGVDIATVNDNIDQITAELMENNQLRSLKSLMWLVVNKFLLMLPNH